MNRTAAGRAVAFGCLLLVLFRSLCFSPSMPFGVLSGQEAHLPGQHAIPSEEGMARDPESSRLQASASAVFSVLHDPIDAGPEALVESLNIRAQPSNGKESAFSPILHNPGIPFNGSMRNADDMQPFRDLRVFKKERDQWTRGWDNEAYYAVNKYFWGMLNGVILEMGALDGKQFSVSNDFLKFGWHRILIEGTPSYWVQGTKLSSDATYIGAAVCNSSEVHYVTRCDESQHYNRKKIWCSGAVNGIVEFMNLKFLRAFHPHVAKQVRELADTSLDFSQVEWRRAIPDGNGNYWWTRSVPCVKIYEVLRSIQVRHINFAIIDVEGAELEVLKSIKFGEVKIDVMCIETDAPHRPKGFGKAVQKLLSENGFVFDGDIGRNSWYHATTFLPRRRP